MKKIKDHSLYFVTSEEYGGQRSSLETARSAVCGGVDILQMREKRMSRVELVKLGEKLLSICRDKDVKFIVNDDPLLAKELDADGVHLGQEDVKEYPVERVRGILGKEKIIGISTHSITQFEEANKWDVDYIAFGPIFHTKTKDYSIGTGDIQNILAGADKPVIFIGGINRENIDSVLEEGAKNIAVIRAIAEAQDIMSEVRRLKDMINLYGGR